MTFDGNEVSRRVLLTSILCAASDGCSKVETGKEAAATELEEMRMAVPMISADGRIHAEGANAVRQVLAVSMEKVRTADLDLSKTYTSEFLGPASARLE